MPKHEYNGGLQDSQFHYDTSQNRADTVAWLEADRDNNNNNNNNNNHHSLNRHGTAQICPPPAPRDLGIMSAPGGARTQSGNSLDSSPDNQWEDHGGHIGNRDNNGTGEDVQKQREKNRCVL